MAGSIFFRILSLLSIFYLFSGCGHAFPEPEAERTDLIALQEAAGCCAYARIFCLRASTRAESEGVLDAARLFAALAYSQQIHEHLYVAAIHHLGGSYHPSHRVVLRLAATPENLRTFLSTVNYAERAPISRLLEQKNRYAARLMVRHAASENRARHWVELLLLCSEPQGSSPYQVCPRCGYLSSSRYPDPYCPQCMASADRFRSF